MADRHRRTGPGAKALPWRTALLAALFGVVLLWLERPSPSAPAMDQDRHGAADLRAYLGGASLPGAAPLASDEEEGQPGGAPKARALPTRIEAAPASFKGAPGR